jgi:hypothetical protein
MSAEDRWDHNFAAWLLGKYVLVGLTYLDHTGNEIDRHEVHGRVKSVDQKTAIVLERTGQLDDQDFRLPPDTTVFEPAEPGDYRLKTTGEIVSNPDALATWTVSRSGLKDGE